MALGMACSDRRRHSWMVDRDGLGRRRDRSMASGLVEAPLGFPDLLPPASHAVSIGLN